MILKCREEDGGCGNEIETILTHQECENRPEKFKCPICGKSMNDKTQILWTKLRKTTTKY